METRPDTIQISASDSQEVQATYADLFVTVKGSSLVSGDAALKKAKEVSQLVEELGRAGLPGEAIHLQSVYTENVGGALLRSSSATYRLRLRCEKLEMFPDLMGVISSQKNSSLERVVWKYPDEEVREAALEKALHKANQKARKVASALDVRLLGIYTMKESIIDQETFMPQFAAVAAQSMPRAKGLIAQADPGMDIQHSKTVEVRVEMEYRISGFENLGSGKRA